MKIDVLGILMAMAGGGMMGWAMHNVSFPTFVMVMGGVLLCISTSRRPRA